MKNLLTTKEIENFKAAGVAALRKKFNISWIEKLKIGIKKDIKSPSPGFKSHTTQKNIPSYLEDCWKSYSYRKAMQDTGYKNGEKLGGAMFPQLWPKTN